MEEKIELNAATSEDQEGPWTNRLVSETSPYLLMHAHNPVDWYPWGEEAFSEARRRDVPIFLSIGYAACHWCHVMEEESFQDPEIAAFLNENFVAIKVDREERPDVDGLYMEAIHLMQGSGGWPASLWLTPDRVPFYGGTYFPPRARYGRQGFLEILQAMSKGWTEDREGVLATTGRVQQILEQAATPSAMDRAPAASDVRRGVEQLMSHWDTTYAGWGRRNKFPMPSRLEFLLAYGQTHGDQAVLDRVREGLEAMDRGGIHDHLAGGFHRYTVDVRWQVPHFEKMLYDNAQLLALYAEASVVLEEERFAQVARDVATYMLRDLREQSGALFSSEDADSPGGEGSYYVWTPQQVEALLPPDQASAFVEAYSVTSQGNFEHNRTVLTRTPRSDPSSDLLRQARTTLWVERGKREPPPKDTKRVVAWNGMALGALARAGRLLQEPEFIEAAREIAAEVLAGADGQGRLPRTLERNTPRGTLDDQAFVALGLLDLYEADPNPRWLLAANRLAEVMLRDFHDPAQGGFYVSLPEADDLLVRRMDATDGAEPSGLGVAVRVLQRLRSLGSSHARFEVLDGGIRAAGTSLSRSPSSVPTLLGVVDQLSRNSMEVVLACDPGKEAALAPFLEAFHRQWRPQAVLAVVSPGQLEELEDFSALRGKLPGEDTLRAYVCFDGVCKMPTSELGVFVQTMEAGITQ